jgi:hypothetical protein
MSLRMMHCLALGALLTGGLDGCTMMKAGSSATLPSSAYFSAGAGELPPLQAIAHAEDTRMKSCHKGPACEDAYYARGLVALFENRADAIRVFQELHTAMPNSRYDAATIGWLNLLQDPAVSSMASKALRVQLRQEVLHTLLGRVDLTTARTIKERDLRVAELSR